MTEKQNIQKSQPTWQSETTHLPKQQTARLEHANLSVRNPQKSAALLHDLFGWHIRWEGPSMSAGHTIYIGSDDHYIALYSNAEVQARKDAYTKGQPLNHLGIVVDDLEAIEGRVIAAGLEPFNHGDYDPGRRFYFFDENGIEFEIVSYAY